MTHTKRIASGYGKQYKWIITPNPGSHPKKYSVPLLMVARDILKYADNAREAKKIINNGLIMVDGIPRKDYKYGVGLMDVISIPKAKKYFRAIQGKKGPVLKEIDEKESKFKLCKIINKSIIGKDTIQLNLHDGSNVLLNSGKDEYKTRDTLVIGLPDKKIIKSISFDVDNLAAITSGRHSGETGKIKEIVKGTETHHSLTRVGDIQTLTDYVFVVGKTKSMISIWQNEN